MLQPSPDLVSHLLAARKVVITPHENPDADALGSSFALALVLRQLGKEVRVICAGKYAKSLLLLPFAEHLHGHEGLSAFEGDCLVVLDCGNLPRTRMHDHDVRSFPVVLNIDHHTGNAEFTPHRYVDVEAAATGILILRLLPHLGVPLNQEIATNLYAAIMTDTGKFSYSNTNEEVLQSALTLFHAGADPHRIAVDMYRTEPLINLKLKGMALARANTEHHPNLIATWLRHADMTAAGADAGNTEGIVETLADFEDACVAAFLREDSDGIKVSLRSREPYDVAEFCRRFGGGGHVRAAGFRRSWYEDFHEAMGQILSVLAEYIDEHKADECHRSGGAASRP